MKKIMGYVVGGLVALAMVGAAMAQAVTDTTVRIPIGTYADYILPAAGAVAVAFILWGVSKIGGPLGAILKTILTEQMLTKAKDYGINMVQGATKDKVLEVDVGNAVVKSGADYVLKYGAKWLIDFLGGETGIKDRLIARLEIAPKAGMSPEAVIAGATAVPGTIPTEKAPAETKPK